MIKAVFYRHGKGKPIYRYSIKGHAGGGLGFKTRALVNFAEIGLRGFNEKQAATDHGDGVLLGKSELTVENTESREARAITETLLLGLRMVAAPDPMELQVVEVIDGAAEER